MLDFDTYRENNRLEVKAANGGLPGSLWDSYSSFLVGEPQMIKGGVSDPRNKNMLKLFNLIGIGERAGSGVPIFLQSGGKKS